MAETSATEYPAMLAYLQPKQAVTTLNERVNRITRTNIEIADWLQERRKVEDQYVQGLKRLMQFKVPNASSELGAFQDPWDRILHLVESVASSHSQFAMRIERDVEYPLRTFPQKKEVQNMQTIGSNLSAIAKELEDAQDKSDRLARKGGRASAQKVDAAATRLGSATQQWDSQAPFIFESLQVLDEQRVNQLRDLLTQLLTHESDQAQRTQVASSDTVAHIIDLQTSREVQGYASRVTDGKTKVERKPAPDTRRSSAAETQSYATSHVTPPASATTPTARDDEAMSETSAQEPPPAQPRLRSRIGTVFSRRRQSMHGGFGPISQKNAPSFGRNLRSSHSGGGVSPRASNNNLTSPTKLPSLAEMPNKDDEAAEPTQGAGLGVTEPTNGLRPAASTGDIAGAAASSASVNGTAAVQEFAPPPGPPPSHLKAAEEEPRKDAEGFTIPPAMDDPISQAQREAGGDVEQLFKLNIQNKPLSEDDEAARAALSNVSSALQMGMPSRKGTVRGRRDVRNTIYVPSPNGDGPESPVPPTPPMPAGQASKPPALAALTSEAGTSDSQSVRSGNSLGTLAPARHPEMSDPGLNVSVIETMTAAFEEGVVRRAKIGGEIAFCYNSEDQAKTPQEVTVRINNFPKLEVIGPNRIFARNAPDRNDEYTLDTSHLGRTATAFTYRVHSDADGADLVAHAPLLIRPLWKPRGDRLELLMQYSLNPACGLPAPVTLSNVVILATYEGRAGGAQTKPSGTHLKEKHLVYWRLGEVTLSNEPQKIVCRVVGSEGELKPGHVEARWEYAPAGAAASVTGISVSRLEEGKGKGRELDEDDPFADVEGGDRWEDVSGSYRLVSGRYEVR